MGRVVQDLRDVREVSHAPFAVGPRQHPAAHPGELGGLEHRRHPALPDVVCPLADLACDAVGQGVALCRQVSSAV